MKKKGIILIILLIAWCVLIHPPVKGGIVTSHYGIRFAFDRFFHTGTDIGLPVGTPVNPVSWGTVTEAGFTDRNGNYLKIAHLPGTESRYLHLDSLNVKEGQKVTPRSVIGAVGNTGVSSGSHLHFEMRVLGVPLPPYILCLPGLIIQHIGGYIYAVQNKTLSPQ